MTNFKMPTWDDIPDIGLYLNQTVSTLEEYLSPFICDTDEKVITNTMINNYVKHNIIPAPFNKKYNREHIAMLFVVCILKQVYTISDTKLLINLAFKNNSIGTAYTKFCLAFENAISTVFSMKNFKIPANLTKEQYVLRNVVYSYATKLYVQKNKKLL